MGRLIDDQVLSTFAVRGDSSSLAAQILDRFGDVADRLVLTLPSDGSIEPLHDLVTELARASSRAGAAR
jgi:hypothetical protein